MVAVGLNEAIESQLQARFQLTWAGCLGGALLEGSYRQILRKAGFTEIAKPVKGVRGRKPGRQLTVNGKSFLESIGGNE